MDDVQQRSAVWRMRKFPDSTALGIVAKLLEESGEVARAVIGDHEHRNGRGDAVQEAAQCVIVLASLVGCHYPDRDLFAEVASEMERIGA